ncbi:unknown [Akkermansia muciniphila CAG:154]|nr:unknown [Akkermansia muciniphila CAG:154]
MAAFFNMPVPFMFRTEFALRVAEVKSSVPPAMVIIPE